MESQHEGYQRVCCTVSLACVLRPAQKARPFHWSAARRFEVCLQRQRPPLLADEPPRDLGPQQYFLIRPTAFLYGVTAHARATKASEFYERLVRASAGQWKPTVDEASGLLVVAKPLVSQKIQLELARGLAKRAAASH